MNDDAILYAVYPGTVTLYDGSQKTWTAANLAAAYGVSGESYLTVNTNLDLPRDPQLLMRYIHLTPRGDDTYQDIKYTLEDDDLDVAYRPEFDSRKPYTMETDPRNVDPIHDELPKVGDFQ